jgi:DNA-3-methyladenine glycosylase
MRLRTCSPEGETEVTLTEVEAYGGRGDPASHAHRGETARNRSMFGPPGTLYVYRSYGVHWCVNITTGLKGEGQAVLLRSGVPTEGRSLMIERRRRADHLADGPGKLAQALGITGEDDGTNVLGDSRVRLLPGTAPGRIVATPRVGISKATGRPWRFVEAEA